MLQCADGSLPGYLPSELMKGQDDSILRVSQINLFTNFTKFLK